MNSEPLEPPEPPHPDSALGRARNLMLAASASQGGCATLVIVFPALFVGLWLDAQFNSKPLFTLSLVVISIPVSLGVTVYVVLAATRRITPPDPRRSKKEVSPWQQKD